MALYFAEPTFQRQGVVGGFVLSAGNATGTPGNVATGPVSLQFYNANVTVGGHALTIGTGYMHTITVGPNQYAYAQQTGDSVATIVNWLANEINAAADIYVSAAANVSRGLITLTPLLNDGQVIPVSASDGNAPVNLVELIGNELIPVLTGGVLFAQGTMYRPSAAPVLAAAPASAKSYLYYNSTAGMYWSASSTPTVSDDAYLGWVVTNATAAIAVSSRRIGNGTQEAVVLPAPPIIEITTDTTPTTGTSDTDVPPAFTFSADVSIPGAVNLSQVQFAATTNLDSIDFLQFGIYSETVLAAGHYYPSLYATIDATAATLTINQTGTGNYAGRYVMIDSEIVAMLSQVSQTATSPGHWLTVYDIGRGDKGSAAAAHTAGAVMTLLTCYTVVFPFAEHFWTTGVAWQSWASAEVFGGGTTVIFVDAIVHNVLGYSALATNNYVSAPLVVATPNATAAAAGSAQQVQFNAGGALGASAALSFDASTRILSVGGDTQVSGVMNSAGVATSAQMVVAQKGFGGPAGILVQGLSPVANYPTIGFSMVNSVAADVQFATVIGQPGNNSLGTESGDLVFETTFAGFRRETARVTGGGFDPSTNASAGLAIGGAGSNYGGGVLLRDRSYYAGIWTVANGASLVLAAGGTNAGFGGSTLVSIGSNGAVSAASYTGSGALLSGVVTALNSLSGTVSIAGARGVAVSLSGTSVVIDTPQDLQTSAEPVFTSLHVNRGYAEVSWHDPLGSVSGGGMWRMGTNGAGDCLGVQVNTSTSGDFSSAITALTLQPNGDAVFAASVTAGAIVAVPPPGQIAGSFSQSDGGTCSCTLIVANNASSGNVGAGVLRLETNQIGNSALQLVTAVNGTGATIFSLNGAGGASFSALVSAPSFAGNGSALTGVVTGLNSLTGSIGIAGAHGVTATPSGSSVVIDTPQDLQTSAEPVFTSLHVNRGYAEVSWQDPLGSVSGGGMWRMGTNGAGDSLGVQVNTSTSGDFSSAITALTLQPNGAVKVAGTLASLDGVPTVLQYGCVGDGVADDTAALRSALAAVLATGGRRILRIPGGVTLRIVGSVTVPAGLVLVGDGAAVSRIVSGGSIPSGYGLLHLAPGTSNVTVSGIAIDGMTGDNLAGSLAATKQVSYTAVGNPTDAQWVDGSSIWINQGCSDITLEGLEITHTAGWSVFAQAVSGANIPRLTIRGCSITNARFATAGPAGDEKYGTFGSGILLYNDGTSAFFEHVVVENCIWDKCCGYGFFTHIGSVANPAYFNRDLTFTGNRGFDTAPDLFLASGWNGGRVTNNFSRRNGYVCLDDAGTTRAPRWSAAVIPVALDSSGINFNLVFDHNTAVCCNGEMYDADGAGEATYSNSLFESSFGSDDPYADSSSYPCGPTGNRQNWTRFFNSSNSNRVAVVGSYLVVANNESYNAGGGAISMYGAQHSKVTGNLIYTPATFYQCPVVLGNLNATSSGPAFHALDNDVSGNAFHLDSASAGGPAVFEDAVTYGEAFVSTDVNRVVQNTLSGPHYEFAKHYLSGSGVPFLNVPTSAAGAVGIVETRIVTVGTQTSNAQTQIWLNTSAGTTFDNYGRRVSLAPTGSQLCTLTPTAIAFASVVNAPSIQVGYAACISSANVFVGAGISTAGGASVGSVTAGNTTLNIGTYAVSTTGSVNAAAGFYVSAQPSISASNVFVGAGISTAGGASVGSVTAGNTTLNIGTYAVSTTGSVNAAAGFYVSAQPSISSSNVFVGAGISTSGGATVGSVTTGGTTLNIGTYAVSTTGAVNAAAGYFVSAQASINSSNVFVGAGISTSGGATFAGHVACNYSASGQYSLSAASISCYTLNVGTELDLNGVKLADSTGAIYASQWYSEYGGISYQILTSGRQLQNVTGIVCSGGVAASGFNPNGFTGQTGYVYWASGIPTYSATKPSAGTWWLQFNGGSWVGMGNS